MVPHAPALAWTAAALAGGWQLLLEVLLSSQATSAPDPATDHTVAWRFLLMGRHHRHHAYYVTPDQQGLLGASLVILIVLASAAMLITVASERRRTLWD